jgi:hypothetical protein
VECPGWCQFVRQGHEDPDNGLPPGRPPIDSVDIRILALPNINPSHLTYSIVNAMGVSHSTILYHSQEPLGVTICLSVGSCINYQTVCDRFGWKFAKTCCPFSKPKRNLKYQRFSTQDDNWFTFELHHSTKWSLSRDDVPQKVKQQIATQKFMLRQSGELIDLTLSI